MVVAMYKIAILGLLTVASCSPRREEDAETLGEPLDVAKKITICHRSEVGSSTITVSTHALAAHVAHGDTIGPCPSTCDGGGAVADARDGDGTPGDGHTSDGALSVDDGGTRDIGRNDDAATDGFGVLSGELGVITSTVLSSQLPSAFTNTIDFGTSVFTPDVLSPDAQAIRASNPDGSSGRSEAMAFEVLHRAEGAVLLKTGDQIAYDTAAAGVDFLVEIAGHKVGVSVTRAFAPIGDFLPEAAAALLTRKLMDILLASASVSAADEWSKCILYLMAQSGHDRDVVLAAYTQLDAALKASTVLLVTVSDGEDAFLYSN
jgi:hypothetical protein